jgi:amino acid transporter
VLASRDPGDDLVGTDALLPHTGNKASRGVRFSPPPLWWGWLGGWAICTTGILVVGSLADVAAFYMFALVEWILGTLLAQSIDPKLSWLNPFAHSDYHDLLSGMLLAVFIYWGWESALNLSEETEDASRAPGLAGISSTVILVGTYVLVGMTVIAVGGTDKVDNFADNPGILGSIADDVLGPLAFLVTIAIIVSGLASAQTTIIPSSRTSLSMAHAGALPKAFSHIHPGSEPRRSRRSSWVWSPPPGMSAGASRLRASCRTR